MNASLPWRHLLLALLVVAVWGTNFVVIKLALAAFPPLLMAALRFALAVFPAILFLPRPRTSWRNLAAYGGLIGVGQFGLLYFAMTRYITPGLASLVVQTQVFFTIALAMRLRGERVQPFQWLALGLGAAGIAVIAAHVGGSAAVAGLAMVLGAALCWAGGNLVGQRAVAVNMVAYMVWTSVFAVPPLLLLSLLLEGGPAMAAAFAHAGPGAWAAVAWQAFGNTLFGYAAWAWLLARHPSATITPMALLVPVFGMGASSLWLGEPLPAWKLAAAALVLAGLGLNLGWPRLRRWIGAAA